MPISKYTAKLADKITLGENFYFLKLELLSPNKVQFNAGQYILLDTPTTLQKRQYSIVSAPRLDHAIELLVEYIPNGHASEYIKAMNVGEEVSFYAPAGEFTIAPEILAADSPLVFVGTGSGLAPLRSMILDLLRTREVKRPIKLHWGMRHAQNLFWLDAWQELADNFPNFSYDIVLSQPPEGWTLCQGRVTSCLERHVLPENADYYLCGNQRMIADVMKTLSDRGVLATKIHHEKFI